MYDPYISYIYIYLVYLCRNSRGHGKKLNCICAFFVVLQRELLEMPALITNSIKKSTKAAI